MICASMPHSSSTASRATGSCAPRCTSSCDHSIRARNELSLVPSRAMTPPALKRPTGCPSKTHISWPSTSSTRGTRSRNSAGAREVNRSGASHQWESASMTSMSFNIDVDIRVGLEFLATAIPSDPKAGNGTARPVAYHGPSVRLRRRCQYEVPMRPLPELTPFNEWYWTSGSDGVLRIQGCEDCGRLIHPPVPICPYCRSRSSKPTAVSGRGTVVGYTVNAHQWHPAFPPPYVIANVALAEDPNVHLTTNIVGCEPSAVRVGLEVDVRFEQFDDVWLPLFELTGDEDPVDRVDEPVRPTPRRPLSGERFEHRAVLSGVGRSRIGRRLMTDPLSLAVDACLEAVADAGLTLDDIDGLSTYPGAGGMGMSEGGPSAIEEALRIRPTWINGGADLPGPGGSVIAAAMAVAAGLCRHVLCFRTVWESTFGTLAAQRASRGTAGGGVERVSG